MGEGSGWGGGQGGCDQRIEVFGNIHKKNWGWGGGVGGVRVDVNEELNFLGIFTKKIGWGVGGRGGGGGPGGQGGCERRIEVFVKIQKKNLGGGGGGGGRVRGGLGWWGGGGGGGQGGCERRIKVFVKIQTNIFLGGGRVGGVGGWVRVDVNAMLGEGDDVGYGGCEPRVEGIVQGTKR